MLGPNQITRDMAAQAYNERLSHVARIQMIKHERHDGGAPVDRQAHRRLTANRLAAAFAATVFTVVLAAGAVAASPTIGGGATILIR